MNEYDEDNQVMSLAHSCRLYKPEKTGAQMSTVSDGISCSSCTNWGSSGCTKNAFDSLARDLDYM